MKQYVAPGRFGVWQHLAAAQGLPDLKIECVFEDSRGCLWIGMHDGGVARYREDDLRVFTTVDGLPDNGVFSGLEAPSGELWFGTGRGIARFDGDAFSHVEGASLGFLWGSCVDPAGRLWFGAARRPGAVPEAYYWDGEALHRAAADGSAAEGSIHAIAVDAQGELWFGGYGFFRFDGRGLVPVGDLPGIECLLTHSDGSMWIGSWEGVFQFDGHRFTQLTEDPLWHGPTSLVEDDSGAVWATRYDGDVLRWTDGAWELVKDLRTRLRGLCLDRRGRMWVGTYGMGIYCHDDTRFQVWSTDDADGGERCICLAQEESGILWVGTRRGLMAMVDAELVLRDPEDSGEAREVSGLLADGEGRLWVGRSPGGLFCLDNGTYRVPSGLGDAVLNVAGSIVEGAGGRIWFGDKLGGSWGYVKDGAATLITEDDSPPGWIGALHVAPDGTLWIGTSQESRWNGIRRYDGVSFERIAVSGGSMRALLMDSDGCLWVGTPVGVVCLKNGETRALGQADGLPHQIITSIVQTADGVLWFGTEGGGVCCYDGEIVQRVEIPGDVALNVVHDILEDDAGGLWIATEGGLVRYTRHRQPPSVRIEGVDSDRGYAPTEDILVPRSAARLRIRFGGHSSTVRSDQLLYRYRLDDGQDGWQHTRRGHAELGRLAPGEYQFTVQAVDPDLNYSPADTVQITVTEDPHVEALTSSLAQSGEYFVGRSQVFVDVLRELDKAAETDVTVLLLGDTGTGKGMASRRIHSVSPRQEFPFIHVNCGSLPAGLVESELFGHERGAFTGAVTRQIGRFEMAHGGTLLLDEVGDLPPGAQRSLLRVIEEKVIRRVGGEREISVDARILAATNRDLDAAMQDGAFREDLYYRLSAFTVRLPALRERPDDIPLLVQYFVEQFARELGRQAPRLAAGSMEILAAYGWPGNVRELQHVVRRAVLICDHGVIDRRHLSGIGEASTQSGFPSETLEEVERGSIEQALRATNWVVYGPKGAAILLGIGPEKLRYRMRKHGIRRPS